MNNIPKPSELFPRITPESTTPESRSATSGTEREQQPTELEIFRFTRGRVKFFDPEKGFGFCIVTDDAGVDREVFFHADNFDVPGLGYEAKPTWRKRGNKQLFAPETEVEEETPVVRRGDDIALGSIRPGSKRKGLRDQANTWTTAEEATRVEAALDQRAKEYPVGLYVYPEHAILGLGDTSIKLRNPDTGKVQGAGFSWGGGEVPALTFIVNQPGEFPHSIDRGRSQSWVYEPSSKIDQVYGQYVNSDRVEIPTIVEGGEYLAAVVLGWLQNSEAKRATLEDAAGQATTATLEIETINNSIARLERLNEASRLGGQLNSRRLVVYSSESQPVDEASTSYELESRQWLVANYKDEVSRLVRSKNEAEASIDRDNISIGSIHIPVQGGKVEAYPEQINYGYADGDTYTLTAIISGENRDHRPARLGGMTKDEFVEQAGGQGLYESTAAMLYDALVEYFEEWPDIDDDTVEDCLDIYKEVIDARLDQCRADIAQFSAEIDLLSDLLSKGSYATMYDLEVAFSRLWESRVARKIGEIAIGTEQLH